MPPEVQPGLALRPQPWSPLLWALERGRPGQGSLLLCLLLLSASEVPHWLYLHLGPAATQLCGIAGVGPPQLVCCSQPYLDLGLTHTPAWDPRIEQPRWVQASPHLFKALQTTVLKCNSQSVKCTHSECTAQTFSVRLPSPLHSPLSEHFHQHNQISTYCQIRHHLTTAS